MKAGILTIGDEILIGQTIDTNSAVIGKNLNKIGVDINQILSVADQKKEIIEGLNYISRGSDLVLITGGLGPTKDDITKHAFIDFFEDKLIFAEAQYDRVKQLFNKRNINITTAHEEQFFLPSKAEFFLNEMGTAPGMLFRKDGKLFFSMPGVPYEMEHLLTQRLIPLLRKEGIGNEIYHKTLLTVGCGETALAEKIEDILRGKLEDFSIAYLPSLGTVKIRLTAKGVNLSSTISRMNDVFSQLEERLSDFTYGEDEESLPGHIGNSLIEKKLTLGIAESCTGGHIGHLITSVPGSSAYFEGGVISYSYAQKRELLNVKSDTLINTGAVSEETVIEMQKGAINLFKTDLSLSVSGIAGPGGGTPDKPVGTIWMACGNKDEYRTKKVIAGKDRLKNMEYAGVQALNLLRQFINEVY